jgi:hypothetical protein
MFEIDRLAKMLFPIDIYPTRVILEGNCCATTTICMEVQYKRKLQITISCHTIAFALKSTADRNVQGINFKAKVESEGRVGLKVVLIKMKIFNSLLFQVVAPEFNSSLSNKRKLN